MKFQIYSHTYTHNEEQAKRIKEFGVSLVKKEIPQKISYYTPDPMVTDVIEVNTLEELLELVKKSNSSVSLFYEEIDPIPFIIEIGEEEKDGRT